MYPADTDGEIRPYHVRVNLPSFVFHSSEGAHLLPLAPIRANSTLEFQLFSAQSDIQPFHVLLSSDGRCFSFVSHLQVENLGGSLLLTYPSWSASSRRRALRQDEIYHSFKHESGVIATSCLNKMTLITTSHLSDRLHDFLTMM